MLYFLCFLIFIFGASLGSFIGAQVWREKNPQTSKKSICEGCGKELSFLELTPFFSSIYLTITKSGCTKCGYVPPNTYLFLEIISGLTLLLSLKFLFENNYLANIFETNLLIYIQLFVAIFYTYTMTRLAYEDFSSREVSSNLVYINILVTAFLVILSLLHGGDFKAYAATLFLSSPFLLIAILSKEKRLGLGDPLVLTANLFFFASTNPSAPVSIFLCTVWGGAIFGIVYMYGKFGEYRRGVGLPFLPFLFFGNLMLLITRFYVFELSDILEVWHFLFG